jgi:predicted nucleotidyltransferase
MSQKNYNVEIVNSLLKKENHIRGLAKELNTNQTTIARKAIELQKENIVDFKTEGKNKIIFLKKTFEAKQFACICELTNAAKIIEHYSRLRDIFEKIRKNDKIFLAILFGSYAKKSSTKDSDIDIYICSTDKDLKKEIELIDSKINVKLGEYDKDNLLIKEIEKNHVIIKGAEEYYEKNRFFD